MKKNKKQDKETEDFFDIEMIELQNIMGNPLTAQEMVNKYGTYNIQPTADTDNAFPKIAQGLPHQKYRKKDKN